ncbi:hypothetical protein [Vampirovibrio sp.]|uniref:hypothetical protein n=1 Tax=Vampirovibrio sp. TaxID=2717857 RepID=UPI0035933E0D
MTGKRLTIGPYMDQPYGPNPHYLDPKKGRLMCDIPFSEIKEGGFYQFEIMQAAAELFYLFNGSLKATAFYEKFFRYEFIDLRSAFIENDYKKWPLRRYKLLQDDKEKIDFFEYSEQLQALLVSIAMAWDRETPISLGDLLKTFSAAPIMSQALYNQFLENPPAFSYSLPKYPGYEEYIKSKIETINIVNSQPKLTGMRNKIYELLLSNREGLTVKDLCRLLPNNNEGERPESTITVNLGELRNQGLAHPKDDRPRGKIWVFTGYL